MDFLADFTAIDFETANRRRDSACQLAAVRVRQGRIVDQAMWMIRPRPLHFSAGNIRIHGITPESVADKPDFGQQWESIAETLGDDCLVAHNATFDIGVLLACLQTHGKPIDELQFTCTRAVARRTWPHRRGFGLKPLADWLGIRFKHHDALEDSIACAKIMLAAGIDQQAETLGDLEKRLNLSRGQAGAWGYRGVTTSRRSRRPAPASRLQPSIAPPEPTPRVLDLQRLMIRAEFIQPLRGKSILFIGDLTTMDRRQAETLARKLGGRCNSQIDQPADFVVVGNTRPPGSVEASTDTTKVLDEQAFLQLITAAGT